MGSSVSHVHGDVNTSNTPPVFVVIDVMTRVIGVTLASGWAEIKPAFNPLLARQTTIVSALFSLKTQPEHCPM